MTNIHIFTWAFYCTRYLVYPVSDIFLYCTKSPLTHVLNRHQLRRCMWIRFLVHLQNVWHNVHTCPGSASLLQRSGVKCSAGQRCHTPIMCPPFSQEKNNSNPQLALERNRFACERPIIITSVASLVTKVETVTPPQSVSHRDWIAASSALHICQHSVTFSSLFVQVFCPVRT